MTDTLLLWVFIAAVLASLLLSTLSYALRAMSRVRLEEALVIRGRPSALDAILSARFELALTASVLRLVSSATAIVAVGSRILIAFHSDPHPLKVFGWTLLITVPILLIFTVAIPQAWAKYAGESLLASVWPLLRVVHLITWPLVRILYVFDEVVRRLAGVSIGEDADTAADQLGAEILSVVAEGRADGTVDEEQKKMIEGVISFRDLQVGQIMTPRTEIVAVEVNTPVGEVRDRILREGLSRVPVYEITLDNVVGILNAKDLLPFLETAGHVGNGAGAAPSVIDLRKIMRPPLFVPRTKLLRDLLKEFRMQHVHIAVVLDEYGGTSGLVTTEDIVEQIVGDITDEYERPAPEELKRIDDRTVEVDARMPVAELNRELALSFPEDGDFQTIGGFVISTLGVIPAKGQRIEHDGLAIIVVDAEPRRIKKLRLELHERAAESAAGAAQPADASAV